MTTRKSDTLVKVPTDEIVDDSLIAMGQTVQIDGVVNGDLIIFAQRIDIRGTVKGNVLAFAQEIEVKGSVEGSFCGFAQRNELGASGEVSKNWYAFAQSASLRQDARVRGDAIVFGASTDLAGDIERNLTVYGQSARVAGSIARNANFSGASIDVAQSTRIGGDLTASVPNESSIRVADGATIGGAVNRRIRSAARDRSPMALLVAGKLLWFLAILVTGWILTLLAPRLLDQTAQTVGAGWNVLGMGFVVAVLTPVALLLAAITLVGLPLALMGGALYLAGLYLAEIVVAIALGNYLLKHPVSKARFLPLLVGLLILEVLFLIPFAGFALRLVVTCAGLGALAWSGLRLDRQITAPGALPVPA